MKFLLYTALTLMMLLPVAAATENIDNILVHKSERMLYLRNGDKIIKEYHIHLGPHPAGHKQQAGDGRTPEGEYVISGRNPYSRYHLSLRISYPNRADEESAKSRGVAPGGDIMIHGTPNHVPDFLFRWFAPQDWTAGCIAVSDSEIEEIWDMVADGTKIEIKP